MTHWFVPVETCGECGLPADDSSHKRKCIAIMLGGRPGAGFCRLEADHAGPHEIVWWNGEVTSNLADGTELEVLEPAKPVRIGEMR